MTRYDISLPGCTPEPLSRYLSALAVLKLVAEQVDPGAMGYWNDAHFCLVSTLDEEGLVDFFVNRYEPTPIVSPWNGGSGFYEGDAREGIDAIERSGAPRFEAYREVIATVRGWAEMPKPFVRVGDVTSTLQQAIDEGGEGKKKQELVTLLRAIHKGSETAERLFGAATLEEVSIEELEGLTKSATGADKKAASAWWKAVRKGRTQCNAFSRGGSKETILEKCRVHLPDKALPWLDAAYMMRLDGTPAYGPVLGTGGNEGKLEFSNNYMQRLKMLLLDRSDDTTVELLRSALFAAVSDNLVKAAIGQYNPGRAGGFNQGPEVETKDFTINPWEFVLMLEGATTLAGSYMRRADSSKAAYAATPFTVSFTGVGYASANEDENGRAETWLPLWRRPVTRGEVEHLFREGRASIGRSQARNGIEFLRAIGTLGVDRGVDEFVRFSFIERRGTNYVAFPAGRFEVFEKPSIRRLDDADQLLRNLDRFLHQFSNVPATFKSARRRLDDALFQCAARPDAHAFQALLRAFGRMAELLGERDRSKEPKLSRPLRGLSVEWIDEADDGSLELRIAAALASLWAQDDVGVMASTIAGVDAKRPWEWAKTTGDRHWVGSDLTEKLAGVLWKRMLLAEQRGARDVPLRASLSLHPHDVVAFIQGMADEEAIEELLWGLTLVNWSQGSLDTIRERWREPVAPMIIPRPWALLKLLYLPGKVREVALPMEPRVHTLLTASRVDEALDVAGRRLRVEGLVPVPVRFITPLEGVRLAAGLLVPTRQRRLLASLVLEDDATAERQAIDDE